MQGIYTRAAKISQKAEHLVEVAAGQRMQSLIERLQQMVGDIEAYLSGSRTRSNENSLTMQGVLDLLDHIAKPLEGFQGMNMTLHMLGVSIKIESACLGLLGNEFINLAIDVEKLSLQVDDKSNAILKHRQDLRLMLLENMVSLHATESIHDEEVALALNSTSAGMHELEVVNDRFTQLGARVAATSKEITSNIGEVVSSLQFHDINRQQIEHVIEALEHLLLALSDGKAVAGSDDIYRALITEVGNVCELQEAQLNFASTELYSAVESIVGNLQQVSGKQMALGQETLAVTGVLDTSDSSFFDAISQGMSTVTAVLTDCISKDHEMTSAMKGVAANIDEITSYVHDIDDIGFEIVLLALNAQIKAAHAGERGAGLGVLAEAIHRLSDDAVERTTAVNATLTEIHTATEQLSDGKRAEEVELRSKFMSMEGALNEILKMLAEMNVELLTILSEVQAMVNALSEEVESITSQIDVHERTKVMADEVLAVLHQIVIEVRELEPASSEFKENLRLMEAKYTMESERRIHEAIANKHGVQQLTEVVPAQTVDSASGSDSEFGDNVDLF
ncbi:MAG: methyl-accepting chemotaxis protein [Desulfobulbaceae bacterium]|nr:methyl-accepting chemotaxis protein [Desulfobulbaceae bacterium]